jgi:hypothetical protein
MTLSKPLDIARRRACFKAAALYSEAVISKGKIIV